MCDEGSIPLPSAHGSMVKWISHLSSKEVCRVRILVGLLTKRKGNPRPTLRVGARDGSRLEAGRAIALPCEFDSRSFR